MESIRIALEENFNINEYLRPIPPNMLFFRFATEPKDIIIELILKELPFNIQLDYYRKKKTWTYKLHTERFGDRDFEDSWLTKCVDYQGGVVKKDSVPRTFLQTRGHRGKHIKSGLL